jgi:hypothetical protein
MTGGGHKALNGLVTLVTPILNEQSNKSKSMKLKPIALIPVMALLAISSLGQPFTNFLVSTGPHADRQIKIGPKTDVSEKYVHARTNLYLSCFEKGVKTSLPVELKAYEYICEWGGEIGTDGNQSADPYHQKIPFIEAEISSTSGRPFHWSAWLEDANGSHDIQLFTTESGSNYLSYTTSLLFIIPVMESKSSEQSFREFWEQPEKRLPELWFNLSLLFDRFGSDSFDGGPLRYDVYVDRIFEVTNELHLTVHGKRPEPKHTFAFRAGKWEYVSSTSVNTNQPAILPKLLNSPRQP